MTYELATLVKTREALMQIESGINRAFQGESGVVRGHDIIREAGQTIPSRLHRALLTILKGAKVLIIVKPSPHIEGTLFSLDKRELSTYMKAQYIAIDVLSEQHFEEDNEAKNSVRVVATLPTDWGRVDSIDPTDEALRRIIIGAQNNLWIISPYFDDFGKTAVEEALLGRGRKGVKIRVVGRQLSQIDIRRNRGSIVALQNLIRTFKQMDLSDYLEIREFTTRNQVTHATSAGLHSKIVIADEKICYIGSANITEWSLSRNFELGIELKGEVLTPLRDLVRKLWEDSAPFNTLSCD